jgi:plasmid stabilization system protein ParE
MPKKVIWSERAAKEKISILEYWINRNKSNRYSLRLDKLIQENIDLLSINPEIGKISNYPPVRIKIVESYFIYYRVGSEQIEILSIWDSRRNPRRFKL